MNEDIINQIVEVIKNMKDGESNTISRIVASLSDKKYSFHELFDIQDKVQEKCEEQGIICDYSKHEGAFEGLPYNLDFVKKTKN